MDRPPLVSVIIPAWNQALWLPEAVVSVEWQSMADWECLIVDDGSTDATPAVAQALCRRDPRLRYFRQDNRGLSAARNAGLAMASGEFVQFLDSDDALAPDKLEVQTNQMRDRTIDVSYSNWWAFDDLTGRPCRRTLMQVGPTPLDDFLFYWERGLTIPIHAALFRRDAWDGQAFNEELEAKEDWLMWVDLAARGKSFRFVDRDLALYRLQGQGMSRRDPMRTFSQLADAAALIVRIIPEPYRGPFVERSLAHIARGMRSLILPTGPDRTHGDRAPVVRRISQLARHHAQHRDADSGADLEAVVEALRLELRAARQAASQEDEAELTKALRQLGPVHGEALMTPVRLAARISLLRDRLTALPGQTVMVPARIENHSDVALGNNPVVGVYHTQRMYSLDGDVIAAAAERVYLDVELPPGESHVIQITARAPQVQGEYLVHPELGCDVPDFLEVQVNGRPMRLTVRPPHS